MYCLFCLTGNLRFFLIYDFELLIPTLFPLSLPIKFWQQYFVHLLVVLPVANSGLQTGGLRRQNWRVFASCQFPVFHHTICQPDSTPPPPQIKSIPCPAPTLVPREAPLPKLQTRGVKMCSHIRNLLNSFLTPSVTSDL